MSYLIAYATVLVVFGAVDAAWLAVMGPIIYRPVLTDILVPSLRIAPAIAFYFTFPIGVVTFAVMPALRSASLSSAFIFALLFGAIAYGTYDLTNYATLRNWTLQITVLDICYGAAASGVASTIAYLLTRAIVR